MVWFGETPSWLQRGEWTLNITGLREIRGVGDGSPVLLSGVEIGRVQGLDFVRMGQPELGVVIRVKVKRIYTVPEGSVAKVFGAMLGIGTGQIQVVAPLDSGPPVRTDGTGEIPGITANAIRDMLSEDFTDSVKRAIDRFGDLAQAATPVAGNLAQLLEQRTVRTVESPDAVAKGITSNLSTAVERLDQLIANINQVLGDKQVQADLRGVAGDAKEASEELRRVVTLWKTESERISNNVNEGIDRTDENLQQALTKLATLVENLNEGARNLVVVTNAMAEGKGTAGLLVHDPRLYEAAVVSFERLSDLLATLNVIASKIERDGYISLGKVTPVGTITKDFPIGSRSEPVSE